MEFFIAFGLIIASVIYISQKIIGQIKWCEVCNSWHKMILSSGQIQGWVCSTCNWINQNMLGSCPTCGWYQKYENRTVSHRGPFRKVDRTPVTPFWGVQEEYWAYEEKIECPKHGIFTAYIPVDAYQSSPGNLVDYDDRFYDNSDESEDSNDYYDREAENNGFY